jgi:hypothetical protein
VTAGEAVAAIEVTGGLCNRLRALLSYRAAHGKLEVVWCRDGEICGGHFRDVFEFLPGVRFISPRDGVPAKCAPADVPEAMWIEGYRELRLIPHIRRRYERMRPGEPYSAIHVRRTDNYEIVDMENNGVQGTTDEEFIEWAAAATTPVYIATDNGTTQRKFIEAVQASGKRAMYAELIVEHARQNDGGQRNTSLECAALDLFMCAGSSAFLGTRATSSFTHAVEQLRQMDGAWWRQ